MSRKIIFTVITFLIGFMIAIQYQTTQEPSVRDTRDARELRKELAMEQEKRQQLNIEVHKSERLVAEYNRLLENREDEISDVLLKQIADLKKEAGFEEKTGSGLLITIIPSESEQSLGFERRIPPPEVFRYLVNELNTYGAEGISVENERIISTSAFRDVNHITYLNSRRLPPPPLEIKVIANDPEILQNHMVVSDSVDYFEMNGFTLLFEQQSQLTIPAHEQMPIVQYMEKVGEG